MTDIRKGIGSISEKVMTFLQGASEMPEYVIEYVRSETPEGVMDDAKDMAIGVLRGFKDAPIASALETFVPPVSLMAGIADANMLAEKALAAEKLGDLGQAQSLRQLATLSVLSIIPGVPRLTKLKAKTPDDLEAKMLKLRETIRKNEENPDYVGVPDRGEPRRFDDYEDPRDRDDRNRRR